jgi:hypothetical protein
MPCCALLEKIKTFTAQFCSLVAALLLVVRREYVSAAGGVGSSTIRCENSQILVDVEYECTCQRKTRARSSAPKLRHA